MPTDPRNVNRRKRIDCLDVGDAMGGKRKARIDTRPCARTAILASASPRGYRTLLVQLASSNVSIPRTARAGAGKTLLPRRPSLRLASRSQDRPSAPSGIETEEQFERASRRYASQCARIAVFDLWIGNEDRVCNLMASIGPDIEYLIVAFDHGRTLLGCVDGVRQALEYLKNPKLPESHPKLPKSHPMSGLLNRAHCELMVERIQNINDDLIYELCDLGNPEALAARVLKDGEALAAGVLLGGGHAQVGDGFHVLSMEPCFLLSILHAGNRKIVPFRVAWLDHPKRSFFLDRRAVPDADPDISRPAILTGSSPRGRGTHKLKRHIMRRLDHRFIPARAGNTTCRASSRECFIRRFIPARAGNTRIESCTETLTFSGSSPRGRGTLDVQNASDHGADRRFIPARAGNTLRSLGPDERLLKTVHPRAGGEHATNLTTQTPWASTVHPRAGGEHVADGWTGRGAWSSVHPRAGGEHIRAVDR